MLKCKIQYLRSCEMKGMAGRERKREREREREREEEGNSIHESKKRERS